MLAVEGGTDMNTTRLESTPDSLFKHKYQRVDMLIYRRPNLSTCSNHQQLPAIPSADFSASTD